jgi:hypothetical protein
LITEEGNRVATKSYDLECRQKDAKELVAILQTTYQNNPKFIFHRMRHKDKKTYGNAIRKQNLYLSKSRVVPIQGVSEDCMFALDNELLQIPGVLSVNRHKETQSNGRWSIMTTDQHFKSVVEIVKNGLGPWMTKYATDFTTPANFPRASLAFKNRNYEDQSDGSDASFATYLSACSSIYAVNDDVEYDGPPAATNAAPQAWGGDA